MEIKDMLIKAKAIDKLDNKSCWTYNNVIANNQVVKIPTILTPSDNSDVVTCYWTGIDITTTPFIVGTGETDTLLRSEVKICSDPLGYDPVITATSTTTTVNFAVDKLDNLKSDKRYYIFARHIGTNFGVSDWSLPISFIAKQYISINGYLLFRNMEDNNGTIVEYTYPDGSRRRMIVADCNYRNGMQWWGVYKIDSPLQNYGYLNANGNRFINGIGPIDPLTPIPISNPEWSNDNICKLWACYKTDLTAKENCDIWYNNYKDTTTVCQDPNTYESVNITGPYTVNTTRKYSSIYAGRKMIMQVPNIFQVIVMTALGDIIDNMDRHRSVRPWQLLGCQHSDYPDTTKIIGRLNGGASRVRSSTEYSANGVLNGLGSCAIGNNYISSVNKYDWSEEFQTASFNNKSSTGKNWPIIEI